MHLFIEILVVLGFVAYVVHAATYHGRRGLEFFGALLFLGFVRENFVALYEMLYGFAPLTFQLGAAPLLAAVIWGFSIYAAVEWGYEVFGRSVFEERWERLSAPWYAGIAVFMMSLAVFYEPFLELLGMARWEPGTRTTGGVPWIALVGYPTLTLPFLWLWRRARRGVILWPSLLGLALVHAFGLQGLKDILGW